MGLYRRRIYGSFARSAGGMLAFEKIVLYIIYFLTL